MSSHTERVLDLYENNRNSLRKAVITVGGNPDAILNLHAMQLLKTLSMNGVSIECFVLEGWDE